MFKLADVPKLQLKGTLKAYNLLERAGAKLTMPRERLTAIGDMFCGLAEMNADDWVRRLFPSPTSGSRI